MPPSTSSRLLNDLNEQQQFAVTHTQGPMLILAGAGSGKTRTITYKIAYLIEQQICRPDQILAVTFTNKAAQEMKQRVGELLGPTSTTPLVSTFHSFSVQLLRRHAGLVGFTNNFTICDADDQRTVYKGILDRLGLSDDAGMPVRKLQAIISQAKNQGWGPAEYLLHTTAFDAPVIHRIFLAYQQYLKDSNALDFDDLIQQAVRLLKENPTVRERYGDWFQYILIDEYQDTNIPQYDLIRNLCCRHQNISAVGDEDQSIYKFRGADIGNILRFEEEFPGTSLVKLEQNYRSTQTILDAATAVVSNNSKRKGKVLWTEGEVGDSVELFAAEDAKAEAIYASHRIFQLLEQHAGNIGVLYRTNFQSRHFEEALRRLNIPYKLVGGQSFYSRKEIKDALAYLRTARNPSDNLSLLRIINEPSRGIGKVTLERVQEISIEGNLSLWDSIQQGLQQHTFSGRIHRSLKAFVELFEECRGWLSLAHHLALERVLTASGYTQSLRQEDTEDSENRLLNLEELITVAREYHERGQTLQEFLDHAALYSDSDEFDASARVTLMTLHNAKGLEFSFVFLAGCEEGLFPHSRSTSEEDLEEERRLCYVGMTRARLRLYLSYSKMRRFYGRDSQGLNSPSRFLSEVPPHLLKVHAPFGPRRSQSFTPASLPLGPARSSSYGGKVYNTRDSVQEFLNKLPGDQKQPQKNRFVSGALVQHHAFGRGRILQVEDVGGDLKITVHFPKGIKKVLQSYAKLDLV